MADTPQKLKYRISIGVQGDFHTIKEAIDWLGTNMTGPTEMLLDSGVHYIDDIVVVNLPYHLNIRGMDFESCYIAPNTGMEGKAMFQLTSSCFIKKVTIGGGEAIVWGTHSGENIIEYHGYSYYELTGVKLEKGYYGIAIVADSTAEIYLFNSIIATIASDCILVNSSGSSVIDIEVNTFVNYGSSAINLAQGQDATFDILSNIFSASSTNKTISYDSTNYTYTDHPSIISNKWNGQGAFLDGFDFTDQTDSNIMVKNNSGYEDKNPHAKINVIDNVSTTTIPNPANYTKVAFTNGDSYTCKMTLANGKMTYQSSNKTDGMMWVSGNAQVNQNNRNINIALRRGIYPTSVTGNGTTTTVDTGSPHELKTGNQIQMVGWTGGTGSFNTGGNTPALAVKTITVTGETTFTYLSTGNGTATGGTAGQIISPMTIRAVAQNVLYPFSINAYLSDMFADADYQLYAYTTNNGDVVIVSDLNWLFDSK